MSELEIALLSGVVLFLLGFIIDKVFWSKAKQNQERIDNAVIRSVEASEKKIIELEKRSEKDTYKIANIEREIAEIKIAWRNSTDATRELSLTIEKMITNDRQYHKDNSQLLAEVKMSMDASNKINIELLGYLKGKSNG
jgi:hypothetical protein